MKQFTFSAQVANNLLTVLQGYSKTIRLLLVMFLTLTVSAEVWGADVVYKTAKFGSSYNSASVSSYTSSWYSTYNGFRVDIVNANNNQNGWSYIKMGSKNAASTGTITTNAKIDAAITKVSLTIDAITTSKITSITLKTATSSNGTYTSVGTFTKATGTQTVTLASPTANLFYKIEVVCTQGSSNGLITISQVDYYKSDVASTCTTNPTVSAGSNSSVTTTTATVSCSGGITSLGSAGCSIESYGFVYGTSSNPTISNTKEQVGTTYTTTGTAFTKELTGLTANTTYYVRPYATNGNGTAYGTQTNFKTLELPKYTVTLNAGSGTCAASVTEASAGAGVTLPTPTLDCGDWEFAGWKTTSAVTTETTTEPTLIAAGAYSPTSDITLYAVYQRTVTTSGGGGGGEATAEVSIADYATAHSWNNDTKYTSVTIDENITATASTGTNTGKYYTSGTNWRFYQTENATLTLSAATGCTIKTVKVTYSVSKTGVLTYNEDDVSSGTATTINATSATFGVGNTGGETNGQVRITAIEVIYTTSGGGSSSTTYYHSTPDCGSTEPSQLATPTGLNVTNITSTSATLSWGEVANASSYTVSVYGENDEVIAEYPGLTEITKTVSDLDPETNYLFGVVAVGDGITYTNSIQAVSDVFTTSAAASPATITLSQLGVTSTIDTYSVGDQYTLPTTSSQSCDGKQLVGWSTVEVAETDTKPTSNYYELGAEVTLAATQTFYAVFAAGSGGGGEGWTAVTSTSDLEAGATYAISSAATEGTYLSTWDGGNNFPGSTSIICPLILGGSAGAWTFQIADGGTYNDRFLTAASTTSNNYLKAVTTADAYSVFSISFDAINKNAVITCTGKASRNILRYNANSGSPIFACYTSGQSATYLQKYATGGGGYTAYSTSCIPTYSITYDFADGDGGHCTDTRVEGGSDYTICDEAPTKDGNTFLHWSDGVNTYNPSDVIENVTTDITLTAVWQPNIYTVIWSNNGVETGVPYNHGDALVVPTAPASCDGVKEFVGWTTHSGYYHATTAPDDIFTTKTTPVTATATYYAVFATPGAGGTEFVLGESGTFKMYANVDGTNHYAQGGVSSSKLSSTTDILTASDYILTYADGSYTIKQGTNAIGHSSKTDLSTTASTWTISAGANGSWRITSDKDNSRALSYSAEANAFKAYATSNLTAGNETYFDIEFGSGSDAHSDYTTICQTVESIEIANYTTEFFVTDEFAFGGTVTAHFDEGEPQDVTALAHFSGYNMNEVGTYTVTVTYMGATATYEITVKPLDNAWVLTWNVSGKTNTGLGPRSVTKNSAIGTLPVPEVPVACAGKTFMGWTESNIVPSDGKGIVYITEETVPTKNTTYYAVFATINNFSTQAAIEDIESGSKVVIVAVASMDASGGAGQAISSRTISITSQGVIGLSGDEVSIFDETINTPHSTCIWTLTKEGGGIVFEQGGKYIRAVNNGYRRLLLETTKDYWTLSPVGGKDKTYHMQSGNTSHYVEWFDHTDSKYDEGERYIGFVPYLEANDNGDFDMQFYVTANKDGDADITDYTTGCAEYTITYYGFHGGYSTSCSSDGTIVLPVNSLHTVPNCGDVVKDHTNLGREFLNIWMTQPHGGHTFEPGDTFILTQDTTLYAQWKMETTSDVTTLPTDIEDLAGTDIYVYGGTTLNIQPGTTTINSLTLKGGLQADGSYKMPTVWVPEGATLVRNSNKINLDLIVNAKTYYPFAVPFATKNNQYVEYLDPVLAAASTYGTHFAIKTYDGARRAKVGEDKTNNWVRVLRDSTLQPGVGYIITALTYPDKDTATIRIPMTVPNTWFQNGEQAEVGTTVRNTIAVTAHAGAAATEHQRHAGWNFVANPYLTSFAGGNVANDGGLAYINGELIIEGGYEYTDEEVPYVTVPAYDFAYYSQHKLSEVKLSPEWSFFVQVGTGGTMNFTTAGRQQAPASIAARNAEERPVKMDVDLILSDNHNSDQTGIIICDRYSDAYEIGRDLEKLFGSAYNLSVYTLMEDNTPLAFQALAIRSSMQVIPVGYRAPEQGEYTFRLNEATSSIDLLNEQYEQLVLVDYQTGELTNLLYTDYTFYSERTQSNSRFAIYAVPRQNAPTDLPNAIGSDEEVRKVIYNDHLYILRDGNVYNGMGQKM
ncbi:MAG: InlB B-repeat-containing protein [Paludibacteraceae bacterium]|nr:InlB B-repeat-containing protein [Paludibacteraceae bacterium]